MASVNKVIIVGHLGRDSYSDYAMHVFRDGLSGNYKQRTGRDHAPALSISDDMPEAGGGGESAASAPEAATSDDDGGDGDGDPDSDRRRSRSKNSPPSFPPALLGFEPLSHYVSFGRSRIYQLIAAGKFPQPIKVGKSSRWVRAEVDIWLSAQIAARPTNQQVGG
nr:AlpA family phage regulatory protein [uncultured Acidovorax sp.]